MKKTTLEFDEELFEEVRRELGTKGLKETVHKAFQEVLRVRAVKALLHQLKTMEGLDPPEVVGDPWRFGELKPWGDVPEAEQKPS